MKLSKWQVDSFSSKQVQLISIYAKIKLRKVPENTWRKDLSSSIQNTARQTKEKIYDWSRIRTVQFEAFESRKLTFLISEEDSIILKIRSLTQIILKIQTFSHNTRQLYAFCKSKEFNFMNLREFSF